MRRRPYFAKPPVPRDYRVDRRPKARWEQMCDAVPTGIWILLFILFIQLLNRLIGQPSLLP